MLKTRGILRRVDQVGRIVIPMRLRRKMGIQIHDSVELFVEDDRVVIMKYKPTCVFCCSSEEVTDYLGKSVCKMCLTEISKRVG
jgi:transcriptional pleiotropic regulator of transition state genes